MLESIQAPLFFGLIAAFVTTLGLLAVALRSDWSQRYAGLFGLTAAGMLITIAFLHLMPEAFASSDNAAIWLATGFFGGLVLSFTMQSMFPDRPGSKLPGEAITPVLAIAIHSFIDGTVYSVTFASSFSAGVFTALSLILHEFPEGVIAFAILRRHGVSNRNAFVWAFLAAAATTPLGVIVSGPFMFALGTDTVGVLFALSAGLLLYVATGPLMAPLKETTPVRGLSALAIGVVIATGLSLVTTQAQTHRHGVTGQDTAQPEFVLPDP